MNIKLTQFIIKQALTKYNEVLATNQKLRDEVDVVRRERVTYSQVRKDMEDELVKVNYEITDQAQRHTQMQKTAEVMKEKILRLKEKNQHDQSTYLSEYDKLQVLLREYEQKTEPWIAKIQRWHCQQEKRS